MPLLYVVLAPWVCNFSYNRMWNLTFWCFGKVPKVGTICVVHAKGLWNQFLLKKKFLVHHTHELRHLEDKHWGGSGDESGETGEWVVRVGRRRVNDSLSFLHTRWGESLRRITAENRLEKSLALKGLMTGAELCLGGLTFSSDFLPWWERGIRTILV